MSTTPRTRSAVLALAGTGILLCGAGLTACSSGDDNAAGSSASAGSTVTVTADPPQGTVAPAPGGDSGGSDGGSGGSDGGSGDTPAPTDGNTGGSGGTGGGSDGSDEDFCSTGMTGEDAVARWAGDVPPNAGNYPWAPESAETDGYDPCAALSWIVLPIEGGTGSSPYQIMLFHDGLYLGTATKEAYGFHPEVSRTGDDAVEVTWTWPRDGESNAGASGKSTAQFRWDEDTSSVAMTGAVPPE